MINKVVLQGRFTRKPEVEKKGGFDMCEFTIAWSEKYKERETKCFLRGKAWREQAKFIANTFDKGQEVIVEGRLTTEEWEKDGQKQSRTVMNLERIHFCGPKLNNEIAPSVAAGDEDFMKVEPGKDEELPFS